MKCKKDKLIVLVIMMILSNLLIIVFANAIINRSLSINMEVYSDKADSYRLFYKSNKANEFIDKDSTGIQYTKINENQTIEYTVNKGIQQIRLDIGTQPGVINLESLEIKYLGKKINVLNYLTNQYIEKSNLNDIEDITVIDGKMKIKSIGNDPFIIIDLNQLNIQQLYNQDKYLNGIVKILLCIVIDTLLFVFIKNFGSIKNLVIDIYENRKLLWNLSKNDFRTKYAGSYLGIIWAFVQPVITVLLYWFVFQVGFKSAPIDNFPFILWLVAGIVPWFFINEAIVFGANSLVEYSYLVKKVVFKINILPLVKLISALFVHGFFIIFTNLLFLIYGYPPTIYSIQVLYYSLCAFILCLGISYATSAIVIFFKDLGQIIGILLQIFMWLTPILWSFTMIPAKYEVIFKLNPIYYIVSGYRDSLINHVWFWQIYNQTTYFWIVTLGMFVIGTTIFKRLKPHLADVL